jgi:hypothetical protein
MVRLGVHTGAFHRCLILANVQGTDVSGVVRTLRNVSERYGTRASKRHESWKNANLGCKGLGIGSCSDQRPDTDHDLVESQD